MHYHFIGEAKTSLGIPQGTEHSHQMTDGQSTSTNPDTAGHTHTTPDGAITGLPIEVGAEAFNDTQIAVAGMLGNSPEAVYPMAFEDKKTSDSKK